MNPQFPMFESNDRFPASTAMQNQNSRVGMQQPFQLPPINPAAAMSSVLPANPAVQVQGQPQVTPINLMQPAARAANPMAMFGEGAPMMDFMNPSAPAAPGYVDPTAALAGQPFMTQPETAQAAGIGAWGSPTQIPYTNATPDMKSVTSQAPDPKNLTQPFNTWQKFQAGAQGVQALGQMALGFQQYGLAQDSFKQEKKAFELNFGEQTQRINTDLEDRQRRRRSANPNAESVESYMNRNRAGQ